MLRLPISNARHNPSGRGMRRESWPATTQRLSGILIGLLAATNVWLSHEYHNQWPERSSAGMLLSRTSVDELPPQQQHLSSSSNNESSSNKTLALLYPPGLIGGYRNQVLRLTSLVAYAHQHQYQSLWLPSLLWTTQVAMPKTNNEETSMRSMPIPMDEIFDIDHWNCVLPEMPLMSDWPSASRERDCWTTLDHSISSNATIRSFLHPLQQASIRRGVLTPVWPELQKQWENESQWNSSTPKTWQRRVDAYTPQVQACRNPAIYGGGTRAGRLWKDAMKRLEQQHGTDDTWEARVARALRIAPHWRTAADACLRQQQQRPFPSPIQTTKDETLNHNNNYLALHARIEVDMMTHKCGKSMEWNLTKILQQVVKDAMQPPLQFHFLLITVSRDGLRSPASGNPEIYRAANLATLDRLRSNGLPLSQQHGNLTSIPVLECGSVWMQQQSHQLKPEFYGSLLASAMNFELAVHAHTFVGVEGSSYSTDIMRLRYFLHQERLLLQLENQKEQNDADIGERINNSDDDGANNYRYTQYGKLERVVGLPPPHTTCRKPVQTSTTG